MIENLQDAQRAPCGHKGLRISLLGELSVMRDGEPVALPASRKTRALLAFLVATGRPHRRERICELLWEVPNDPKASLRWALTKLRKIVDSPGQSRLLADRERVALDAEAIEVDIRDIRTRLRGDPDALSLGELEDIAQRLDGVPLDGLDSAGDESFQSWLYAERQDALLDRTLVLKMLATHPDMPTVSAQKWHRLWSEADPEAAEEAERHAPPPAPDREAPPQPLGAVTMSAVPPGGTPPGLRSQRIGFCQVRDRTKIAYATLGSGPPLMKAANWLSHLEFDWTGPIWGKCFAEFARRRTFVRYDERGCGLSDWEVPDLSFDAFVEDLEVVVDKLGLERFPLLGISQGAAVSIEYAARHPERVSGLILIGGYASGWRHHASAEEQARRDAVRTLTEVGWGTDNPSYRHIFSQTFMPDADAAHLAWFDEFQRLTTSPGNAARFQDAFGDIDVRDRLGQVRAPTIVLHSRHDQRIPLDQGREMASAIPDAQFVPLESRNHILVDHEPAWAVCMKAALDFLAEHRI